MKKTTLYALTETACLVALAVVLSWFKISTGGLGGSIDFVMIPLFVICYRRGFLYGIAGGLVFGFIKCLIGGGIGYGLVSILLDYVLAYAAVGTAGFFKKPIAGTAVATGVRFLIHFISGVTIYAITASETVYGITTASPFIYSVVYNAPYVLVNGIVCAVIVVLLEKPMAKIPKSFK